MKKTILLAALLCLCTLPALAGKVVTDSLYSNVLKATVKFNVYTPDNVTAHRPVLYLLHGLYGCNKDWEELGHMRDITDELIASDECCEMVVVMPNAGGKDIKRIQNGYFNVPGWAYEDFFFGELLPHVEAAYNCGGCKAQRAIAGLSMGGGGSMTYAQRHPDMFGSCYAMSAWLDNNSIPAEEMAKAEQNKFLYTQQSVHDLSPIRYLENADKQTVEALKTVRWFIDCGDGDFLLDVNVKAHQLMRNQHIHSELRVRNGIHNWEYWRAALRLALPFVTRGFSE